MQPQTGHRAEVYSLYNQGLSANQIFATLNLPMYYIKNLMDEWDERKKETVKNLAYSSGSNFILCTTDQKVLDAYKAMTGQDYKP